MKLGPHDYLAAARVPDAVPSGEFGLWTIKRIVPPDPITLAVLYR